MPTAKPFQINVSDEELELLRKKLELARLPDQPEGYDIKQGVPVPRMKELVEYWKSTYLPKWRQTEKKLNQLPMFTQNINVGEFGDLNIHFVHQRSEAKNAIPLLFVHGWPGSFLEVIKLLPLLTEEGDHQSFHVVAPSLPNYGFSQGVSKVSLVPYPNHNRRLSRPSFYHSSLRACCHEGSIPGNFLPLMLPGIDQFDNRTRGAEKDLLFFMWQPLSGNESMLPPNFF